MSNTLIQIKRSSTTAEAILQPGELAYTSNGEILFIGSATGSNTSNTIAIGGKRTPGTLTANQALVANNSSWIDAVQTAKLIIGSAGETINVTSISTDGTIDGSNNSGTVLLTANAIKAYVDTSGFTGIGITNSSIANTLDESDTLTLTGTTNEIDVGLTDTTFTFSLPDNVTIGANLTITNHMSTNTANVAGGLVVGGTLSAGNTTITGDLTVTGTVTTVDTTNLVIEDSLIRLARNQANTASFVDAVDIGFYGVYGNTSESYFAGLARESGTSSFVLFANNSSSPDNDGVETTDNLASLYAYLNSGALVSNATNLAITANSTVNVAIIANTLTLTTALEVQYGGTGATTLTANGVLYGNGTGAVQVTAAGTHGQVLQVNSSGTPVFATLDGGTF